MDRDINLLAKQANQGCAQSKLKLAEAYLVGINTSVDEAKGLVLLQEVANQTQPVLGDQLFNQNKMQATQQLAEWYRYYSQPIDWRQSAEWYNKLAMLGDANAYVQLGWIYYDGKHGITQNLDKAKSFFSKAVENGVADGYFGLGWCYYFDDQNDPDHKKAVEFWQKGAQLNQPDCFNNVGVYYLHAQDGNKSEKKAFEFFEKGANCKRPKACFNLAQCYHYGWHAKKDLHRATQLYITALEFGFNEKHTTLSQLNDLAEQNCLSALLCLAEIFSVGRYGLGQDYKKAFDCLEKAKQVLADKQKNDLSSFF